MEKKIHTLKAMEDANKRDREFLERIIEERDRSYADRFRALEKLVEDRFKAIEKLIDERDRLYDSRFKAAEVAVSAALAGAEKAVNAAFMASEKAIVKAEAAQNDYNVRSNEFRGQLADQASTLMPRPETTTMFKSMEDKIHSMQSALESEMAATRVLFDKAIDGINKDVSGLRESRSEGGGRDMARKDLSDSGKWAIGIVIAVVFGVLGFVLRR
jgi:hypothetical protein